MDSNTPVLLASTSRNSEVWIVSSVQEVTTATRMATLSALKVPSQQLEMSKAASRVLADSPATTKGLTTLNSLRNAVQMATIVTNEALKI